MAIWNRLRLGSRVVGALRRALLFPVSGQVSYRKRATFLQQTSDKTYIRVNAKKPNNTPLWVPDLTDHTAANLFFVWLFRIQIRNKSHRDSSMCGKFSTSDRITTLNIWTLKRCFFPSRKLFSPYAPVKARRKNIGVFWKRYSHNEHTFQRQLGQLWPHLLKT